MAGTRSNHSQKKHNVESKDEDEDEDNSAKEMAPQQQTDVTRPKKNKGNGLKRKLRTLETNYDSLAHSEAGLRAANQELEAEITLLKDHSNNDQSSSNEATRQKYKKSKCSQFTESQAKVIRDAGKKFAAIQRLWLPLAAWDFIAGHEGPNEDEDEDEPGWDLEEQAKLKVAAKEVLDFLPSHLRSKTRKAAFRSEEGMRELRAPFVNKLAQEPVRVFDIHDKLFHKKTERSRLPEARLLLDGKQFLYGDKPPKAYLKHSCVLQALRLLLFGPSSLTDGEKSSKTRGTYDSIWGLTEVNHGILSFVSTALYFVLSGATEFSEKSDSYHFDEFYAKRQELLDTWQHSEDPAKRQEHDDLLLYFNRKLWPNHHPEDPEASRFDSEVRQLLAHVAGDGDGGSTGQNDAESNENNGNGEDHAHG